MWSCVDSNVVLRWSVIFADAASQAKFKSKFYEAMYEQQAQKPFPKVEKERRWLMGVLSGEHDDMNTSRDSQSDGTSHLTFSEYKPTLA